MPEGMMVAERSKLLRDSPDDKGNGYRQGAFTNKGKIGASYPRDRYDNFHPQIPAVLRSQEEECDPLASSPYLSRKEHGMKPAGFTLIKNSALLFSGY